MTTFEALYRDHCNCGCDAAIWPGDECVYVDDEIVLVGCVDWRGDQPVLAPRPLNVCTSCWLTKPCFCED